MKMEAFLLWNASHFETTLYFGEGISCIKHENFEDKIVKFTTTDETWANVDIITSKVWINNSVTSA